MSLHIGKCIKKRLDELGKGVEWFAGEIGKSQADCEKIIKNSNIDALLLVDICKVLDYNFFKDLSDDFQAECRRKGIVLR